MIYVVNGVDFVPYIKYQGLTYEKYYIDSPNAGRTLDGVMQLARVAEKLKWNCAFRPLDENEVKTVLNALQSQSFMVTFTDPYLKQTRSAEYYTNNISMGYCMRKNNKDYWFNMSAPIIEV